MSQECQEGEGASGTLPGRASEKDREGARLALWDSGVLQRPQFLCSLYKGHSTRLPWLLAHSKKLLAHSWGWSLLQTGQK